MSHVVPNLTTWTFPYVPVIPSVQVSRPLPQSQPTPIAASLGSTPLPTTIPILPVTCGGTVYYLPPPVVATLAVASTSTQPVSSHHCSQVRMQRHLCYLQQLPLVSGNSLNIAATLFNGINCMDSSRALLTLPPDR